jgi:hypothetical protein
MDRTYLVREIKAALEAHGVNLTGPCGSFQITSRVAWALEKDGVGLVAKNPGQNGCTVNGQRYAIDAVMLRDGQTWDLLVNGGGVEDALGIPIPHTGNEPAWQVTGAQPPSAWRAPFNPDAGTVDPSLRPDGPPPQARPDDLLAVLVALDGFTREAKALREDRALVDEALMNALASVRSDLSDLRLAWAKGLSGRVLGYPVTLKP